MQEGTYFIQRPYIEARCTPLRDGGWRVDSIRGTTEHPGTGDPYLAVDRHLEQTISAPAPEPETVNGRPASRDASDGIESDDER
jgi:hypothetical protein